jgi:hypothetical protein
MNIFYDYGAYMPLLLPWYIMITDIDEVEFNPNIFVCFYDTRECKYIVVNCIIYGVVPNYETISASFFDGKVLIVGDVIHDVL